METASDLRARLCRGSCFARGILSDQCPPIWIARRHYSHSEAELFDEEEIERINAEIEAKAEIELEGLYRLGLIRV
jgi:hypothetical protein